MEHNPNLQRKKSMRYKFLTSRDVCVGENCDDSLNFYYQICTFPEPKTGQYNLRKFIINGKNEFVAIKNFKLTKKQCKQFYKLKKNHEYKRFNTYDLENVEYPYLSDILTSKSDILSHDYNYTGFAPF